MENYLSKYTDIRKGCVFSLDLNILYIETFLKELEVLPGFIINGSNINMIYATVLIIYLEHHRNYETMC